MSTSIQLDFQDQNISINVVPELANELTPVFSSLQVHTVSDAPRSHALLTDRSQPNAHPISAITNLSASLPETISSFDILDVLNT